MIRPLLVQRRGTDAATVLFVHGTMDQAASFRRVAAHLPHWTTAGYDRRGWGRSRALAGPQTQLNDHVADLVAAASHLNRPVVAGHSYGALLALAAAARDPDRFRAVVAYEPPVPWLPWWPRKAPWERAVEEAAPQGPAATAQALQQAVTGRPRTGLTDEELASLGTALLREMTDPTLALPPFDPTTMRTPVVTASGTRSPAHHQRTAHHLAHLIPAGRHTTIDGADHIAHITHPQRFAELVDLAVAP